MAKALVPILLAVVFGIGCLPARAQVADPVPFDFYANGKYKVFAPLVIPCRDVRIRIDNDKDAAHPYRYDFKFNRANNTFSAAGSSAPAQVLSVEEIKKINKQLAARIRIALDNLADSVALRELYTHFWDAGTYSQLTDELRDLADELEGGSFNVTSAFGQYPDFQSFCQLERELASSYLPYTVSLNFNSDSSRYDVFISKTDWFHECLRHYWETALKTSTFNGRKLNRDYAQAWKEIEKIANKLVVFSKRVTQMDTVSCDLPNPMDRDSLADVLDAYNKDTLSHMDEKVIPQLIAANQALYQATFWFNYGYFGINPMGYTTSERTYKVFLYDKEAARIHDTLIAGRLSRAAGCCNMTENGIDSLIKARRNGKIVFSTDTVVIDRIWGYNDLATLRKTQKMLDKFEAPVTLDRRTPQLFLQFDGSTHYAGFKENGRYKGITSTDSLSFVVHNIGDGIFVSMPQTIQPTTNTSGFQDAFAALSGISGLITATGQLPLASFNNNTILAGFGSAPETTQPHPNITKGEGYSLIEKVDTKKVAPQTNTVIKIGLDDTTTGRRDTLVIIRGMTRYEVLVQLTRRLDPRGPDLGFIHYFFTHCYPDKVYADPWEFKPVKDDVEKMREKYNEVVNNNRARSDSLRPIKNILNSYHWVIELAAITDRSLPPLQADLAATTDSAPVFRTQINPVPVYDSTRGIQTMIVEKKLNKKDTLTTNYPIYPIVRIGKKVFFALSAGIAVTTNAYEQKSVSITGGQVSVTNNAADVSYLLGINYYPNGLFQIDNRFLGLGRGHFKNRWSIFAGVGLPNPLQNYYAGGGLDLVPGFKLIAGGHLFLNTRYQIVSDQIVSQQNGVKWAGPFVALNIDPVALINLLGFFK